MNFTLVALGLVKVAFGGGVAAVGILLAFRGLNRILGTDPVEDLRAGNRAAGLVHAASLLALGLLVHSAVRATFDAVDLTFRAPTLPWTAVPKLALFALLLSAILVVLALLTGPGLQAMLDGLIPFPKLPADTYVSPR